MTKRELVESITWQTKIPRIYVGQIIKAFTKAIQEGIRRGGKVTIYGIGTFKTKRRGGRFALHIQTGETFALPPDKKISFKPSAAFRKLAR